MRRPELDLPLADTISARFLQWTVAGLTLLAVCALAVAALGHAAVREAARRPLVLTIALTVPRERVDDAQRALLDHLRSRPGVLLVEPVPEKELAELVDPWLAGSGALPAGAFLPPLVDVALQPGAVSDPAAFQAELRQIVPELSVGAAAPPALGADVGRLMRAIGLGAGVSVLVAAAAVAVALTRMSLGRQEEAVDLLRLMGANDRYLVRQYELHAAVEALRGAAIGFVMAVLGFLAVLELARKFGGGVVQSVALRPVDWVLLAIAPVVLVLVVTFATRIVATRGLARWH